MGEVATDIATLTLSMPVSSLAANVGEAVGSLGTHNVPGGGIFNVTGADSIDDELIIGHHGTAFLNVTSGGQVSLSGPYAPGCTLTRDDDGHIAADFDQDGDADLTDVAALQRCFSGDGIWPDPNCYP